MFFSNTEEYKTIVDSLCTDSFDLPKEVRNNTNGTMCDTDKDCWINAKNYCDDEETCDWSEKAGMAYHRDKKQQDLKICKQYSLIQHDPGWNTLLKVRMHIKMLDLMSCS